MTTKQRVSLFRLEFVKVQRQKIPIEIFRKAEVNEKERKKFEENFKGLRKRSQETCESGFLRLKLNIFFRWCYCVVRIGCLFIF